MSNTFAANTVVQSPSDDSEIIYNSVTHMFDVMVRGVIIDEVACYGDGEGSILIYLALREAEEAQAAAAYERHCAARHVMARYPGAVYLNWREAFRVEAPILADYIIITRPNGYTVHANLNAGLGAVVEVVTFGVQQ